jgi:enoyl-CoA hydratase/carnithine racemase
VTETSGVRLDLAGPVATITLCRPEVLNAQTPEMWARLCAIEASLTGETRVVVVRGEGRAFSAGLDLAVAQAGAGTAGSFGDLASQPAAAIEAQIAEFQRAFSWLRRPSLVSIAAVQGHAIGAGFQLALACDLRIAADDAKFSMAEVKLGLVPDLTGTKPLVDLVGYARALEMCVTGRRVDAAEADRIGLVNLVVPAAELEAAVADLAAAILAGNRTAITEIKALLSGAAQRDADAQYAVERAAQARRLRDLAGLDD